MLCPGTSCGTRFAASPITSNFRITASWVFGSRMNSSCPSRTYSLDSIGTFEDVREIDARVLRHSGRASCKMRRRRSRSRPASVTTSTFRPSTHSSSSTIAAGNHGLVCSVVETRRSISTALLGSLAPRNGAEYANIAGAVSFRDSQDLLTLCLDEVRCGHACSHPITGGEICGIRPSAILRREHARATRTRRARPIIAHSGRRSRRVHRGAGAGDAARRGHRASQEAPAMILVATGPLVAAFDPQDRQHARCVKVLQAVREPILTTTPVLTEAFHMLGPASTRVGSAEGVHRARRPVGVVP